MKRTQLLDARARADDVFAGRKPLERPAQVDHRLDPRNHQRVQASVCGLPVDVVPDERGAGHFFFRKNVNSLAVDACDSSALPVCLEKASKSLTEPGSVATIRSTCPLVMSVKAFFALRMGNGQLRPRASRSLSKFMALPGDVTAGGFAPAC